jgi:hypothetical protein
MSMDDFLRYILPVANFTVSLIALGGVFFAWKQINQVNKWNKILSAADFVDAERVERLLDKLDAELIRLEIPTRGVLLVADAERIRADTEACKALTRYLTYFERLAAIINIGAIDNDLAYQFMVCDVLKAQEQFANFINHKRACNNDDEIMIELDKLACRWMHSKAAAHAKSYALRKKLGLQQRL